MPILDAHRRSVRDGIRPEEVDYLMDTARTVRQMRVGDGLMGYAGESGIVIAPHIAHDYAGWEEPTANMGFFAKILDHGPAAQGDYGDERYWVQELFEASPDGSTIHDNLRLVNEALLNPPPETVDKYPVRWVTATNLVEIPTASHIVPTDGTVIVRVSMLRSPDRAAKFYFNRGGGVVLMSSRFVAVVGVVADMVTTREINRHIVNEVWDRRWEFAGDVESMFPWPLEDASEYSRFVTVTDDEGLIDENGYILNAFNRGGLWFVAKPAGGAGLPVFVMPDNTAMFGDYFEAHILDANGNRTDTRVKVAKPFDLLRSPFHDQTIRWASNFEVRYDYWSDPTMRTATRLAHGAQEEDEDFLEIVWKPYNAVQREGVWFTYPLWALEVGEAVTGVQGVPWLDLNVDGRVWVER